MSKWGPLLGLFGLAILLMFLGLGTLGLTDRDEGSNAEAAREMLESGDWITPTLNGEPRFAKPAFVYWLMSGAYRFLGVSEFSARFASAFFGVALILLQCLFLTHVRGKGVGLLGGVMLLLNIEMVAIGRLALTDSVLIFFTTLSLYGFWLGLHGEGRQRAMFWLFYVGMAIGTLTKGPIGVVVPLLGVVPYLSLTKRWPLFWQRGFPLGGVVVFLLLALPWYGMMLAIHGSRYTASAQADTVGRFFNVIGGHGGTVLLYVPVLLVGFFPWSGFLPFALYQTLKTYWCTRSWASGEDHQSSGDLELFSALWIVGVFVFFSVSATRLPHYIGPLFPAAAILTASYWNRCLTGPIPPYLRASLLTVMGIGYGLGLTLTASLSLYSTFIDKIAKEFPMAAHVEPGWGLTAAGFVLLIGMAFVGYFGFSEDRRAGAFWAAGSTIALVLLIIIQVALPRFSKYFITPPQDLAYTASVNLHPHEPLILYGPPKPSLIFYAKRAAVVIRPGEEEKMRPYLTRPGRAMILLPSRLKSQLPSESGGFSVILERYGYSLLANEPMVRLPPSPPPKAVGPHGQRR
ncbi:MAG: ArnT family glycosyltransferase [Nitrospiraceae bacterium]